MNQRTLIDRLLTPAGFGLVLLFFLLPFVTMSCSANGPASPGSPSFGFEATFTGVDLLVGGSPDLTESVDGNPRGQPAGDEAQAEEAAFDDNYGKYYPPQPLAVLAAAAIFAGMIMALLLPAGRRAWPSVAAALVGSVLLAIEVFAVAPALAQDAVTDVLGDLSSLDVSQAVGQIDYGTTPAIGFWTVIVILVGLGAWQAYVALRPAAPAADLGADPPGQPSPDEAPPPMPTENGPPPGAQSGGTLSG